MDSEYGSRRCHRALEPQQTNGRIYERSLLTSLPRPLPSVPPMRGKLPVGTKFIIQEYRSRCSLARGIDCGLLQVFDLIYEYAQSLNAKAGRNDYSGLIFPRCSGSFGLRAWHKSLPR